MAELMLESKANGTWEYEILEKKVKIKHKIVKGFNEIPEDHIETLEADLGYQAKVKKGVYVVLKGGKAIKAKNANEKPLEDAKDLEGIKDAGKAVIADLNKKHAEELKVKNDEFTASNQKLIDSRGEALQEVAKLKEEITTLTGKLAQDKSDFESLIKTLEAEKADLEKTVVKQAAEIKKLKAK